MAAEVIGKAAMSVDQCSTREECKIVNFSSFSCVDCVWIVGNDNVKAAIEAKGDAIRSICRTFESSGCKIIPSGCPGIPLDAFQCQAGQCVLPPSR
jgi:hypothetical protein